MVFEKGSLLSRIRNLMLLNRTKATNAEKTGDKIPAHFIQEVVGKANNEEVITVHWGPAVSKNPYLTFAYSGSKGDEVELSWTDNKGNTDSKTVIVK